MKMDPVGDRPTNRDLGLRLVQVHDCLEGHKKSNDAHFHRLTKENHEAKTALEAVKADVASVKVDVAAAKADLMSIKEGFGMQPGQKPTAGTSTPWQAWRRTLYASATGVTTVAVVYKVILAAGPGVWEAIKGLMHAAAHGLL